LSLSITNIGKIFNHLYKFIIPKLTEEISTSGVEFTITPLI
jgi:hypothetical protein